LLIDRADLFLGWEEVDIRIQAAKRMRRRVDKRKKYGEDDPPGRAGAAI